MTRMRDAKFEVKLALCSKNDMTNLVNFNMGSGKSDNWHSDVLHSLIVYKVLAKKSAEKLSLMTLKSDPNCEEKLTFCLKNDMNNSVNFNWSSGKSDGIFLSKVWNV